MNKKVEDIDLIYLFKITFKNYKILLSVFAIFAVLSTIRYFSQRSIYSSHTILRQQADLKIQPIILATKQLEILQTSKDIFEYVISSLVSDDTTKSFYESTFFNEQLKSQFKSLAEVQNSISTELIDNSRKIKITLRYRSGKIAIETLKLYVDFLDYHLQQQLIADVSLAYDLKIAEATSAMNGEQKASKELQAQRLTAIDKSIEISKRLNIKRSIGTPTYIFSTDLRAGTQVIYESAMYQRGYEELAAEKELIVKNILAPNTSSYLLALSKQKALIEMRDYFKEQTQKMSLFVVESEARKSEKENKRLISYLGTTILLTLIFSFFVILYKEYFLDIKRG